MPTLTMQAIADLTRVQREVVSIWRTRYADSAHPFPHPVTAGELLFDVAQVADWLRVTRRGNNPDASLEAVLFSSRFEALGQDLEASSTLLLLHDVLGGPLAELDPAETLEGARGFGLGQLVDLADVATYLGRTELVRTVDELAEAAFSGRNVLDRLTATFTRPRGPWSEDALTVPGADLVVDVVEAMAEQTPRRIDAHGSGGLLLAMVISAGLGDDDQPTFGIDADSRGTPEARALYRMLAAHAGPDRVVDRFDAGAAADPHLSLTLGQQITDPQAFFDQVDSLLLERGPADAVAVIGPADLLVEELKDDRLYEARARLLVPALDHPAELRYVARLPKGLSRFGGRRRLALWVFGAAEAHAGTDWTVYGEHVDTELDTASRSAIASDVAAALTGGSALTSHAFLRSTRLATDAYLRRRSLVLAPFETVQRRGGESLARIWELDDGLLSEAVHLQATDNGADPRVSWTAATSVFAAEVRGTRLPVEAIGASEPGSAGVIGPEEIQDPRLLGRRAIDRLVLEKTASRSTFTEPGDVVFAAEGGAAAFVDTEGGHVLQAPVRALRCRATGRSDRILHPHVVAADIAAQQGRDRRTWRLRTVPAGAAPALDIVATRLEARRTELITQLSVLDALEAELIQAVAAGTLAAAPATTEKEN